MNSHRDESAAAMDWNVVVTTFDGRGLRHARRFFARYGEVGRTPFHNVLVVKVPDLDQLLRSMSEALRTDVRILNDISRMVPAQATFEFNSIAEFGEKARAIALQWSDRLAGRSFHVRLHQRRGDFSCKLSSLAEERALDEAILNKLLDRGQPGRIEFADPDLVIDIETVGSRCGMSIWSRDDRKQYPFLRPD